MCPPSTQPQTSNEISAPGLAGEVVTGEGWDGGNKAGDDRLGQASAGDDSPWWRPDSTDVLRGLDRLPLLRQLALERKFRWICFLLLSVAMGLGVGMAPVWVVTPPGTTPVLRISALDYLDSLEHGWRSERAWERGEVEVAMAEWRTALARHPARIRLLRRGLERVASLPAMERREPLYQGVVTTGNWLLRLTATNRVDVDLVVRALDGPCSEAGLMAFLARLPGKRTPVQSAVRWVAEVRSNGFGEREPGWPPETGNGVLDRDVSLCRLGWVAARGHPEAAWRAWSQLESHAEVKDLGVWVTQLQLWVMAARGDLLGYESMMSRVQRLGAELPVHSVMHWKLLVERGRKHEARELARRYCGVPVHGQEVLRLAGAFLELGLDEWAFQFLGRQVSVGNHGLDVWLMYSGELARRGRWEDVSEVGVRLRGLGGNGGWQHGLGLYLEGLSRHGRGEGDLARRCFERASRNPVRPVSLGMELGRRVLELGYPECSHRWLEQYEPEFAWDWDYWRCRARAAGGAGNWGAVEMAARRRLAIHPGDGAALNDLVAVGLTGAGVDEGVVSASQRALLLNPKSMEARFNRVLVWIRVGRYAEATAWLALMDEGESVNPAMRNRLRAARFELGAAMGRWERAAAEWEALDLDGLEPKWRERLRGIWRAHEIRGADREKAWRPSTGERP